MTTTGTPDVFDTGRLQRLQEILDQAARIEAERRARNEREALEKALEGCRKAAEEACQEARDNLQDLDAKVGQDLARVREIIKKYKEGPVPADQEDGLIRKAEDLIRSIAERDRKALEELDRQQAADRNFNVVLYGQTMSGKSTLMEILTKGKGESIGNGTPRTTRDIRSYHWKGMEITDVPGSGAFEGEEDQRKADEAALKADLIVHLITDSNPQQMEAQAINRTMSFDRPVMGIINVKKALSNPDQIDKFLYEAEGLFAPARIEDVTGPLKEMMGKDAPGVRQPDFIPVHLLARFNAEQPEYAARQEQLKLASRFHNVEAKVIQAISRSADFAKYRSIMSVATHGADTIVDEMLHLGYQLEQIAEQCQEANSEWERKRKEFLEEETPAQAKQAVQKATGVLRRRIESFLAQNWESKDISKLWEQELDWWKRRTLDPQVKEFQEQTAKDIEKRLKESAKRLESELQVNLDSIVSIPGIQDLSGISGGVSREAWKWGTTGFAGVLGIAAAVTIFIPGLQPLSLALGIAAGVVSAIGGFLSKRFKSKSDRQREAYEKLRPALTQNVNEIEGQVERSLQEWVKKDLAPAVPRHITHWTVTDVLSRQADALLGTAHEITNSQMKIQKSLLLKALTHYGLQGEEDNIRRVARVPGQAMVIETPVRKNLSPVVIQAIKEQFPERALTGRANQSPELAAKALGLEATFDKTRRRGFIAPTEEPGKDAMRRIAQMLTGYHITQRG